MYPLTNWKQTSKAPTLGRTDHFNTKNLTLRNISAKISA